MSIHPQTGPSFASAYLDDILLVFWSFWWPTVSHPSSDSMFCLKFKHLNAISSARKLSTWAMLSHLIKIALNPAQSVKDFPAPTSVKEVWKFVGLTSYYCQFVKGFAQIAHQANTERSQFHMVSSVPSWLSAIEGASYPVLLSKFWQPFQMPVSIVLALFYPKNILITSSTLLHMPIVSCHPQRNDMLLWI